MKIHSIVNDKIQEVIDISAMFNHLHDSGRKLNFDLSNLKYVGYGFNTIHYHIYRMMMLTEEGLKDTWRYRDQNVHSIVRYLTLLDVYRTQVDEESRLNLKPLSREELEFFSNLSKDMQFPDKE